VPRRRQQIGDAVAHQARADHADLQGLHSDAGDCRGYIPAFTGRN
jgi:hypothetical protein